MITLDFNSNGNYGVYSAEVSVSSGNTSDWVKLEYNTSTSVAVHPSGANGRAKCEYTLSDFDLVQSGGARWLDWPLGNVRQSDADFIIGAATAVRLVSINGAAVMEVLAK